MIFPSAAETDAWIEGIQGLVKDGRPTKLEIAEVDGEPVCETGSVTRLEVAVFLPGYEGMTFRG